MRFSQVDGRRVALWGVGRETQSFARHAAERLPGARIAVVISDDPDDDTASLQQAGARIVPSHHAADALAVVDLVVRSPGVSAYEPHLRHAASQGVVVTTATGLWLAERQGRRVIGITGTKGKSTTATLTARLVEASCGTVQLAGNIGRPALDLLDAPPDDWVVCELSSYQAADLTHGPQVAVVTNLFPEHLDWHRGHDNYVRDKLRLCRLPGVEAVVAGPAQAPLLAGTPLHTFATPDGWHADGDAIMRDTRVVMERADMPMPGAHNVDNLCAALTAVEQAGIPLPPLPDALAGVEPLPHRLQRVHVDDGIEWVSDSISTTPQSTLAAVATFAGRPLVVVAGGVDRGQDFTALAAALVEGGHALVALPDTGTRLADAMQSAGGDVQWIRRCAAMPEAVDACRQLVRPGGVVLLSPAAASYNQYRDYAARGDHFAQLARAAVGRGGGSVL